jgi:hypothetical protein
MNKQEYKRYLNSSHWEKVKERYWKGKLPNKCYCCQTTRNLQLHHKTYKRLGKERLTDLIYLCDKCHSQVHEYLKENKTNLWNVARKIKKKYHGKQKKKHKNKQNLHDLSDHEYWKRINSQYNPKASKRNSML